MNRPGRTKGPDVGVGRGGESLRQSIRAALDEIGARWRPRLPANADYQAKFIEAHGRGGRRDQRRGAAPLAGVVAVSSRVKYGRRYPRRRQQTITVEAAGRIVQALGIPPCEVCGL